ncbi:MAG TPA: Gfo/Idh/MocA family oxidoreductase [Trebonia sp.]|jgi:myo-inositol 2-dehydrogenase/D-chiro-inositol 1-dehydrogenase|nr:Gfo/Idh/MocA family oxidoreductase [Trebonia sp.]
MRLGLLGAGRIGAFHARTLRQLPAVESLVVSDAVPALAERVAARVGAEVVASPEEVLAAGVDGVVIAASTDAHPSLLRMCLAAGVPAFCEKPVARSAADGARLAGEVAAAGVQVQIGYPRRFDAGFAAVRSAVASGSLGRVHTVRSTTLDPAPPPREYIATSGGIFRDCSVHDFDAVRWVTGQEVVEVYAAGASLGADWFDSVADVTAASAVLTLAGGALAVVSNSEVVAGARTSPCPVADAVETGWVAEACALSLREHRPVRVAEVRG